MWLAPSNGSLTRYTSPGANEPPNFASSVFIAFGIEPSWSGIVTACAIVSPDGAQSAAEKSIASRTTAECAVRKTVVAISSASVASALPTIRTAIASSCAAVCASTATWSSTSAPLGVEANRPAGRHDDRRVVLVDEQRARAQAR